MTQANRPYEGINEGNPRSLGEIASDVLKDASTLIRQEVELAKAEVRESATRTGQGAGRMGGAGVAGVFALLFLSLALWWASPCGSAPRTAPPSGWAASSSVPCTPSSRQCSRCRDAAN